MAKRAPKAPPVLTDAQVAARVNLIDDARQKLTDAGSAAAAAQARFDGLGAEASDDQRQEALDALNAAERAVTAAREALETLVSEDVTLPPAEKIASVTVNLSAIVQERGLAFVTQDADRVLAAADEAVAAGDVPDAIETLTEEIAAAGLFVNALEEFQARLWKRLDEINPPAVAAAPGGTAFIRVTGPKSGRRRAGHTFAEEARDLAVSPEELALIEADPSLKVERL